MSSRINIMELCFGYKIFHFLKESFRKMNDTTPLQSEDESINDFEASNGDSEVDVLASYPIYKIELRERENEFTDKKEYRVFCGTWNVNGRNPPKSLKEWLCNPCRGEHPDMYVIGFQEIDTRILAHIFDLGKEGSWRVAVKESLPTEYRYKEIKVIRMVGIMMLVYVKESLENAITLTDADSVATGFMGILGNKGGVGVRMDLHNTSLCFVNAHLAAHQERSEKRNKDLFCIKSKMVFRSLPLQIVEHDQVFLVGDLNYRVDFQDAKDTKELDEIGKLNYSKYREHDQFHRQMGTHGVLARFSEKRIYFGPTYKYKPGSNERDTRKKRWPAWCDRILYLGEGIEQVDYISHSDLTISDHKPVSSLFKVKEIKVVDKNKFKEVLEDIMEKEDKKENDLLPKVELNRTEFKFKDVMFKKKKSDGLTIRNIGQECVEFEFINKLEPLLKITPSKSVITEGSSCEVQMDVLVDETCVATLNALKRVDIVVLHLYGGKDLFIQVKINVVPSSFGSSLDTLVQMHRPIRAQPDESMSRLLAKEKMLFVPKEVKRLVEHIRKYGIEKIELFQSEGTESEFSAIIDSLDTGRPEIIPGSVHSVAKVLIIFLKCLPEPVIPSKEYDRCLDCLLDPAIPGCIYHRWRKWLGCSWNYMMCKKVLSQIPENHRNLFQYLCVFLRDLLKHSDRNRLNINILASIFGEILLCSPANTPTRAMSKEREKREEIKRMAFVSLFLTDEFNFDRRGI